ncbi:complement decay-accelerating factor-like [Microcebus murinus]|uniref:complement decay-accelerating factor-like n=1 Tax=Microcebus murinus TaxID=30608 RepID=UPI003F6B429E
MRPAGPSASVLLRVLGGLHLLLLLWPPATRGGRDVRSRPGTCGVPPDVEFATLSVYYRDWDEYPVNTTVEYICIPEYTQISGVNRTRICLPNLEWSSVPKLCRRFLCPVPKPVINGEVRLPGFRSEGSLLLFLCHDGYQLVGPPFVSCIAVDDEVRWNITGQQCTEITCDAPPQIPYARLSAGEEAFYVYNNTVTYSCDEGFSLVGEDSIQCTLVNGQGDWSGPGPTCEGNETIENYENLVFSPSLRRSRAHSGCSGSLCFQFSSEASSHGLRFFHIYTWCYCCCGNIWFHRFRLGTMEILGCTSQAVTETTNEGTTVFVLNGLIGILRSHMFNFVSFAHDTSNHWLADLAKEELRRKCTHVHRLFLIT